MRDADPRDEPLRSDLVKARFFGANRRSLLELLGAFAIATCMAVAVTWPLAVQMNSHILGGGGDSTGAIWWLWRSLHDGLPLLGVSNHLETGAPFGWIEGNGINVSWALVSLPMYLAARVVGDIAAYNLMILGGLVSSGVTMYALVRRLRCGVPTAYWAAGVFIIFPWHLEKSQGHGALATIYLFPLLLWAGLLWYERPSWRRGIALAVLNLLMWLTSGYFGVVAGVGTLTLVIVSFGRHRRAAGWRRALARAGSAVGLLGFAAGVVLALIRLGSGPTGALPVRAGAQLEAYGARFYEFLLPSYRSVFFGDDIGPWLVAHLHGSNPSEASLTLGWTTLLLALGFILLNVGKRRVSLERRFACVVLPVVVLTAVLFALPNPIRMGGLTVMSPSGLVHEIVPSFRVPTRFMPLIMVALVPIAALMLDQLTTWGRDRMTNRFPSYRFLGGTVSLTIVGVAGIVSFVELSTVPPALVTRVDKVPEQYLALARAPKGSVAEYPLVASEQAVNSDYLFWQRVHGRPLVNGAGENTFADAVRDVLVNPRARGTAGTHAMLGTSAIILRPPAPNAVSAPSADPGPGYRLLKRVAGGVGVWEVTASPADALGVFTKGFGRAEIPGPQETARWMGAAGEMIFYATRSGVYRATFDVASFGQRRLLNMQGATHTASMSIASNAVALAVRLPGGFSRLRFGATPGPQRLPDGRLATMYMTNWSLARVGDGGAGAEPNLLDPTPIASPPSVVLQGKP